MPDAFVNLQHHLVGHQYECPLSGRARFGGQELNGFRTCFACLLMQRLRVEQLPAALIGKRRMSVRAPLLDNISFPRDGIHVDAAETDGLPDICAVGGNRFRFADAGLAIGSGLYNAGRNFCRIADTAQEFYRFGGGNAA